MRTSPINFNINYGNKNIAANKANRTTLAKHALQDVEFDIVADKIRSKNLSNNMSQHLSQLKKNISNFINRDNH